MKISSPTEKLISVFFTLAIIFSFVRKLSSEFYFYYDLAEKLFPVLLLGLYIVFIKIYNFKRHAIIVYIFGLYLLIGIGTTIINNGKLSVVIYQIYHELKFPLIVSSCILITLKRDYEKPMSLMIKFMLTFSLILVIFRFGMSSTYDAIFSNGAHKGAGDFGSADLKRYAGFFWHPSQLAIFCILSVLFFDYHKRSLNTAEYILWTMFSIILLLLTVQRFELLIFVSIYSIILLLKILKIKSLALPQITAIALLVILLIIPALYFKEIFILSGFSEVPRFVFYKQAYIYLLDSQFLGVGWGNLGSHAAADMTSVYNTGPLSNYWWVKEGLYFYDTYWPHVIGETGIFAVVTLIIFCLMLHKAISTLHGRLVFFVLIMSSIFSSNLQSIFYLTIVTWFILHFEQRKAD
ncbi:MAG: hypothetical protein ACI9VT_001353 [Psychroserpens sp.]|jgi:hypothetical protein